MDILLLIFLEKTHKFVQKRIHSVNLSHDIQSKSVVVWQFNDATRIKTSLGALSVLAIQETMCHLNGRLVGAKFRI